MEDLELNNSDQEFINEMMEEMDEEESLLEEPTDKRQQQIDIQDGIRVIEIDEDFLKNIQERCEKGSKPVTRLSIQIFNSVFNENQISGEAKNLQRKYIIFDPEVMQQFLNLYLEQIPVILENVGNIAFVNLKLVKEKSFLVLKYTKTILEFWSNQKESKMIKFISVSMTKANTIFQINPRIHKKFLTQLAESLVLIDDTQAKLSILLATKNMVPSLSAESVNLLFKVSRESSLIRKAMINCFGQMASTLSYVTHNNIYFTINCINELLSLDQSITFIIFFDLIKKCFERLKKTMKNRNAKNITKLYGYRVTMTLKLIISFLGFCEKSKEDFRLITEISYPLVELIQSLLELYPHSKYYPLFLKHLRMLIDIQKHLHTRIPLSSAIFKLMNNRSFLAPVAKSKNLKRFDFEVKMKAGKEYLKCNVFWTDICKEFVFLLSKEVQFSIHRGKEVLILEFGRDVVARILLGLKNILKQVKFIERKEIIKKLIKNINETSGQMDYQHRGKAFSFLIDRFHESYGVFRAELEEQEKYVEENEKRTQDRSAVFFYYYI